MMKAGTYYIGDLCYVMPDWDKVCDITILGSQVQEGEFVLPGEVEIPFAMYGTMYGDGGYDDQECNSYSVDSGTIGCVETKYLSEQKLKEIQEKNLGHIYTFDESFETSSINGCISFGRFSIDTDPIDDYDDGWAEYCAEQEESEEDD
jgi:hypothetical protein